MWPQRATVVRAVRRCASEIWSLRRLETISNRVLRVHQISMLVAKPPDSQLP